MFLLHLCLKLKSACFIFCSCILEILRHLHVHVLILELDPSCTEMTRQSGLYLCQVCRLPCTRIPDLGCVLHGTGLHTHPFGDALAPEEFHPFCIKCFVFCEVHHCYSSLVASH